MRTGIMLIENLTKLEVGKMGRAKCDFYCIGKELEKELFSVLTLFIFICSMYNPSKGL